ncbi:MAG: hypothetical protein AB7E72_04760 [Lysobacterales bacterium]
MPAGAHLRGNDGIRLMQRIPMEKRRSSGVFDVISDKRDAARAVNQAAALFASVALILGLAELTRPQPFFWTAVSLLLLSAVLWIYRSRIAAIILLIGFGLNWLGWYLQMTDAGQPSYYLLFLFGVLIFVAARSVEASFKYHSRSSSATLDQAGAAATTRESGKPDTQLSGPE